MIILVKKFTLYLKIEMIELYNHLRQAVMDIQELKAELLGFIFI